MFSNDIIIYENETTINKIRVITEMTPQVWCFVSKMINISSDRWMKMKITDEISKSFRVFKILSKNKIFINKKFDALHKQSRLKKTTKSTFYAFLVFVIWHTVHLSEKKPQRKNRMMIDIRDLNKMSEFDAYFMSFQSDIISSIQNCKFISVMNCAAFFHQWRVAVEDRYKLTVITHRGAEQWNVVVMKWKGSSVYVQREIDGILKTYPYARAYIDDVMIFSNSLKKHLLHFNEIFVLFQKWSITFKTSKTYFDYFSVSLLNQKIDNFEFATAAKKLKVINEFEFFKTLKNFEIYFDVIEYFKNYVSYYAQKSKSLNKRKTKLLKNSSIKKIARKNFSKKILLKHAIEAEFEFYRQLQNDFSRISWFIHFNREKKLFADVNVSRYNFGVAIYHVKKSLRKNQFSDKRDIELILFFSKMLTEVESKYWSTELKMTALMWTVRHIAHMIQASKYSTVIYTNHETNPIIAAKIRLNTTNIVKGWCRWECACRESKQMKCEGSFSGRTGFESTRL